MGRRKDITDCIKIDVVFGTFVLLFFHSRETIQSNPVCFTDKETQLRRGVGNKNTEPRLTLEVARANFQLSQALQRSAGSNALWDVRAGRRSG